MVTTKPEIAGAFAVAYRQTGWYSLDSQYRQRPTLEIAELRWNASRRHPGGKVEF